MKILKIFIVFLLGINIMFIAGQEKKPVPPKVEKKIVIVKGNQPWINTEFRIRPQDRVTLTATGQVCFNTSSKSCVDPDGYQDEYGTYEEGWPSDHDYCFDPLREENHASLIVDIGSEMFFAGNNKIFSGKDGYLYLGINDCTFTGENPNRGEFSVIVKIERNALNIKK